LGNKKSSPIATTPGEEGKWFATAKELKLFGLAMELAKTEAPVILKRPRGRQGITSTRSRHFLSVLQWLCFVG